MVKMTRKVFNLTIPVLSIIVIGLKWRLVDCDDPNRLPTKCESKRALIKLNNMCNLSIGKFAST